MATGGHAAQLMPFARQLTAADPHSAAAALAPRQWSSLRCGRLITNPTSALPQMQTLSLGGDSLSGSQMGDWTESAQDDAIED
jgi:hypothetical protein